MKNNQFHTEFTLNGHTFKNAEDLLLFSESISGTITQFLQDWFNENDYIGVKTSGSTGKPKIIRLQKAYMRNSANATANFFQMREGKKALCCLPIDYIAGKMMLVRALTIGWKLKIVEPSINPLANETDTFDFAAMVPLQLKNSISKLSIIDTLIVGGGAVSNQLEEEIQNISTKIYATYGMTETITHIAVKRLNTPSNLENKLYYQVLPNVKISKDYRDCLVINAPEVTDEKIVTNDMIELVSDQEFIWKGRFDNVINSGGIKLHPEEIERKLASVVKSRFFVAGISDEFLGEKLILVIESDDLSSKEKESLYIKIESLSVLSKFEKPKEIYFVTKFIETDTKKIQRKKTLDLITFKS